MQRTWIVAGWFVAASAVTGVLVVAAVNGRSPSIPLVAAIVAAPIIVSVVSRWVPVGDARSISYPPPPGAQHMDAVVDDRRPPPVTRASPVSNQWQDAAVATEPLQEAPVSVSHAQASRRVDAAQAPTSEVAATVEWLGGRVPAPVWRTRTEPSVEDAAAGA